jgi:hypothetical protein
MRVIAALPQLLDAARQVVSLSGKRIQIHAIALLDGEPQLVKITVEKRGSDQCEERTRFYDIKGVEIKSVQDAFGAFPSEDGGYPAFPEREITLRELAEVVKKVEGGIALGSSPSPESAAAEQAALAGMDPIYPAVFKAVSGGATVADVMKQFKINAKAVENNATQALGQVKAGSMNALGAYRMVHPRATVARAHRFVRTR